MFSLTAKCFGDKSFSFLINCTVGLNCNCLRTGLLKVSIEGYVTFVLLNEMDGGRPKFILIMIDGIYVCCQLSSDINRQYSSLHKQTWTEKGSRRQSMFF